MALEFRLPDIGEGVAEGEVVKWLVAEGDPIREDQPMVEVMTDKATVEIPAPASGKVKKIHAQAGQVVPVGSVLVELELAAGATAPKIASHGADHPAPKKAAAPAAAAPAAAAPPPFTRPAGQRATATPSTRRLAREKGIDIEKVRGTGPGGRVTEEDLGRGASAPAAAAPASRAAAPAAPPPPPALKDDVVVPIRGLRKKI